MLKEKNLLFIYSSISCCIRKSYLPLIFLSIISLANAENNAPNENSTIYVNQIGYLLSSPKIAFVSSPTGLPFEITEFDAKKNVFSGMLELVEPNDASSGSDVWSADFSIVNATGRFTVSIPGVCESLPFQIGTDLYKPLVIKVLNAFYLHRSGTDLPKGFAGNWSRNACHLSDGVIFSTTASEIIYNATGGWFDGGDYGKYTVNGVYAAGTLLSLFDFHKNAINDGAMLIPEHANGVPDILDEIRWELEFLIRMQNSEGAVHHKLTTLEPCSAIPPDQVKEKRFVFPPSTAATAGTCALLAKASRLYSPYDATFAETCFQKARLAWNYLETHPTDGGFENPPSVHTKTYKDADDSDERFWAAMEMYLSTNEPKYQEMALAIEKKRIPLLSASGYWGNVMPLAIASILNATPELFDKTLRKTVVDDLFSLADIIAETIHNDGFRTSLREGEFTWGSNGTLLENAFILCLADKVNHTNKYYFGAMDQLHNVLGRNPLSMCYVTGFGSRSPKKPYHLPSITDKIDEPIPGLLVAGPNQILGDSALKKSFSPEAAPMTMYLDSDESASSNETDLTWNAVLAFVAAYLTY